MSRKLGAGGGGTPKTPIITLKGSNPYEMKENNQYREPGCKIEYATERFPKATIQHNINNKVPGSYTVTYNYTSKIGLKANQVTRTVIVIDRTGFLDGLDDIRDNIMKKFKK